MMSGPPVQILLKERVKSSSVALHLKKKAKENLDRDQWLGVIRKLTLSTMTEQCAMLVWVTKPNGELRYTIDLVRLNNASKRQLNMTTMSFQQASKVPEVIFKTVMDAWNGYHSVAVHEDSWKYFNFGTQFSTYLMCVDPQWRCVHEEV